MPHVATVRAGSLSTAKEGALLTGCRSERLSVCFIAANQFWDCLLGQNQKFALGCASVRGLVDAGAGQENASRTNSADITRTLLAVRPHTLGVRS
jgi:hypothetical protein